METVTTSEQISEFRNLFNEVDPAGIYFSENQDEYDPEIRALLKQQLDLTSEDLVLQALGTIFSSYFEGLVIPETKTKELAARIVLSSKQGK